MVHAARRGGGGGGWARISEGRFVYRSEEFSHDEQTLGLALDTTYMGCPLLEEHYGSSNT